MSVMNVGVRTAPAADGGVVILGAFCSTCDSEVMPNVGGFCIWCGTRVVDEDKLTARAAIAATNMKGGRSMTSVAGIATCKIDGCEEPSVDKAGPYGRLCAAHKEEKRSAGRQAPPARRSSASSSLAEACKQLVPLARKLDTTRARVGEVPSTVEAKQEFDEATRRASQSPTPENLLRAQDATAALLKVQPNRAKLELAVKEAESAFKAAFETLAADVLKAAA